MVRAEGYSVPDDKPSARMPYSRRTSTPPVGEVVDYDLAAAARRIVEGSLGVVPGELLAIIVDASRAPLGAALAATARDLAARAEVVVLEELGPRPLRSVPASVRDLLARAQASVLLIGFVDSEMPMRGELIAQANDRGLRHAHMVGVGRSAMLAGFSVDPKRVLDATRAVRSRLRLESVLTLKSPAGSDLEVRIAGWCRWQERVGIVRSGRWENLPSGELFTCPAEVNGVFVADGAMGGQIGQTAGVLTRTPVRFEVRSSVCRGVTCPDRVLARNVEAGLRAEPNGDRVGMVMLGTNVGILRPTGEILCDQNLPGLHIGFGATFPAQTGASWTAASQLALTGTGGSVDLDGAPLLRGGRYVVS
jgi:leucyl aminopeptidase (aminopeptidase T)